MDASTLGERVRSVRRRRGLTQRELALAAGLSESFIKKVEQGQITDVRLETLHKIAVALKVTTSSLAVAPDRLATEQVPPESWEDVRKALYRPASARDGEPATEQGVLGALAALMPDLAHNKYVSVRAVLPALIRDAASLGREGRTAQSRVYNATAWLLTQTRQWDDAATAASLALDAAPDRQDSAAAVNTMLWCLLRQGLLAEAMTLGEAWATRLEPASFRRATPSELADFGKVLLYIANTAVRDAQPGGAREALRVATMAAAGIGREIELDKSTTRTFGPASVGMGKGEIAIMSEKPEETLAIAGRIPSAGLLHAQSASRKRHQLDIAAAHVMLRQHDSAVQVLSTVQHEAPEWLAQQQYGRDILGRMISRRRTLTPKMRELADATRLPL